MSQQLEPTLIDLPTAQILFQKMAEETLDKTKWNPKYIKTSEFIQDVHGYKNKDNPEKSYPPTFNWYCRLASQRADGEFFQVRVKELKEEIVDGRINSALATGDFENAIETLKDFEDCNCNEVPCERHKDWL